MGNVLWKNQGKWKWSELNTKQRIFQIFSAIVRVIVLLGLLYVFIISLGLLGDAFRVLGGTGAGKTFSTSNVFNNPIANLVVGILCTVLLQSSSTTISIGISMTSVGLLEVDQTVFMVMGANIGTSITNTIVSLGQVNNTEEFRRAFAGATVHDMFNILSVLVLLPLETLTHMLRRLSVAAVNNIHIEEGYKKPNFLKKWTKPVTSRIISVNKDLVMEIGLEKNETVQNALIANSTMVKWINCQKPSKYFIYCTSKHWSDIAVGSTLMIWSLFMLICSMILIVKVLQNSLKGNLANSMHTALNMKFPDPFSWLSDYALLLVGFGSTIILQSSSIVTSSLTPMCGIGLMKVEKLFPVTVGANVGTTFTGILAAMGSDNFHDALIVAFCHMFFNLFGTLIWFVIPFMRNIPISLSKRLGNATAHNRGYAVVYMFCVFAVIPSFLLSLSMAGWQVMLGVLLPFGVILITVVVIGFLRKKKPDILPKYLQDLSCFPKWLCKEPSFLINFHKKQLAKAERREAEKIEQNKIDKITFLDRIYMALGDARNVHIEATIRI